MCQDNKNICKLWKILENLDSFFYCNSTLLFVFDNPPAKNQQESLQLLRVGRSERSGMDRQDPELHLRRLKAGVKRHVTQSGAASVCWEHFSKKKKKWWLIVKDHLSLAAIVSQNIKLLGWAASSLRWSEDKLKLLGENALPRKCNPT